MSENKTKNKEIYLRGISQVEVLLFTKHLAMNLKSGFTLSEGIEMLYAQAKGKMKSVLENMLVTINSGESFSKALSAYPKYFSPIYINLIKTGEISGTLEENLEHLSKQMKKLYDLKKKVKAALMYPALIFIAIFALGLSVAVFVLPKIIPLFRALDIDLPFTTKALIFLAGVFEKNGIIILIASIITITFLIWLLKRDFIKPITHRVYLKIPFIKKIIIAVNLEKFFRTFGMLLERGIPVDKSLQITMDGTTNKVYKSIIAKMIPELQKGSSISKIMNSNPELFPLITTRMVGMGEKTGNLSEILTYLSNFYESEVDETMKNLSTILEPALLIIIGVVVGGVALAILGPIYQITGNLRG
ncbi:hypothetical protein GF354_02785 [Candidatus Peregrinibacteria bacterium]|nr:hypothetical protein [Candidatus Peregrinibacteria bacterium]